MPLFEDVLVRRARKIGNLAESVHNHLERHEIKKAKKEVKKIISLDADALRLSGDHLHDQQVIVDLHTVLNDAKQLLSESSFVWGSLKNGKGKFLKDKDRDLVTSSIKELIRNIKVAEEDLILHVHKDEHTLKLMKKYWEEAIDDAIVYHGTNSAALPKIKRYGLVPGMKIYDVTELKKLIALMKKSGCTKPCGFWYEQQGKCIFFTGSREHAENYARRSPEFWSQLVVPTWLSGRKGYSSSKEDAYRTICAKLCGNQYSRLEKVSKNKLTSYVKEHSTLNIKEINLGLKIFEILWRIFGKSKPVVLHISIKAPVMSAVFHAKHFEDFLRSFSSTLQVFEKFPKGWSNIFLVPEDRLDKQIKNHFMVSIDRLGSHDASFDRRIPARYIKKYEYC